MNPRLRLLIIAAVVIIGLGVVLAVLFSQGGGGTTPATTTNNNTAQTVRTTPNANATAALLPTYTPIPMVDIVVAVQQINRGQEITPDMVDYRSWPEEAAPINAITDIEVVIGKIARTDIYRESPITNFLITENLNDLGAVGSDAAAIMPIGTRLIAIPIDRITSVAYAIQPGDRVDVIISLLYVDIDEDFQSILPNDIHLISPSENGYTILAPYDGRIETVPLGPLGSYPAIIAPVEDPRPRLTTQMTVQNALVVYAGDFPPDGRIFRIGQVTPVPVPADVAEPTAETPTNRRDGEATPVPQPAIIRPNLLALAVSPQEAVTLTYFVEAKVPITFALRPANETGTQSTQQVTLDFIMQQYNIALPARRPYAIEPAIRSIRQLIAGQTIDLRPPAAAPAEEAP